MTLLNIPKVLPVLLALVLAGCPGFGSTHYSPQPPPPPPAEMSSVGSLPVIYVTVNDPPGYPYALFAQRNCYGYTPKSIFQHINSLPGMFAPTGTCTNTVLVANTQPGFGPAECDLNVRGMVLTPFDITQGFDTDCQIAESVRGGYIFTYRFLTDAHSGATRAR